MPPPGVGDCCHIQAMIHQQVVSLIWRLIALPGFAPVFEITCSQFFVMISLTVTAPRPEGRGFLLLRPLPTVCRSDAGLHRQRRTALPPWLPDYWRPTALSNDYWTELLQEEEPGRCAWSQVDLSLVTSILFNPIRALVFVAIVAGLWWYTG